MQLFEEFLENLEGGPKQRLDYGDLKLTIQQRKELRKIIQCMLIIAYDEGWVMSKSHSLSLVNHTCGATYYNKYKTQRI